jgi:hypothetical protein
MERGKKPATADQMSARCLQHVGDKQVNELSTALALGRAFGPGQSNDHPGYPLVWAGP